MTSGVTSTIDTSSPEPTPECYVADDCAASANPCREVECREGRCEYAAKYEGLSCGATLDCSQERCVQGECTAVNYDDHTPCGGGNAFCPATGGCHGGSCEALTGTSCTYTLSGFYSEAGNVEYMGQPAYALGTNYEGMFVTGTLSVPAQVTFRILMPAYNSSASCGGGPKSAALWLRINNSPNPTASWGNYLAPEATWITAGPFDVSAGPVELRLEAGEGDGCGWPEGTDPIYVAVFDFVPSAL